MIESYVLGVADPQEAAELQRLSLEHPEIAAAIEECEKWLNTSANAGAVPVSANIKQALFNSLDAEFNPATTAAKAPGRRVSIALRYLTAASLLLLIASAGLNVYLYKQYTRAANDYIALQNERNTMLADNRIYQTRIDGMYQQMQIMSAPGMLKVSMPGVSGKENNLVTLYWDTNTKDVYLITNSLPKAPAGKQYQLWALVDGKPVDAGMLEDCEGLCRLKPVQKAQAFAITLEKAGGSPTPTMDQMYVLGNVRS